MRILAACLLALAFPASAQVNPCETLKREAADFSARFLRELQENPQVTTERMAAVKATLEDYKKRIAQCEL